MGEQSPTDAIRLAATQSLRGIICVGVMWDAIVDSLAAERAQTTLDALPFEVRVYLRAIDAAQPSSLIGGRAAGPVREAIRRWCGRAAGPTPGELRERLAECARSYGGDIPRDAALVWDGYLAALIEWGLISPAEHAELLGRLPEMPGSPVMGMFLGWEPDAAEPQSAPDTGRESG